MRALSVCLLLLLHSGVQALRMRYACGSTLNFPVRGNLSPRTPAAFACANASDTAEAAEASAAAFPSDIVDQLKAIADLAVDYDAEQLRQEAIIEREREVKSKLRADSERLERALAESPDDEQVFTRNLKLAEVEGTAEACAAAGDLRGAVEAYSELLEEQPPTSPELSEAVGARRALQQLLLESLRRELEACERDGCEIWDRPSLLEQTTRKFQDLGEETRQRLASRALEDVGRIRSSVVRLLEETEAQASADAEEATSTQAYLRLVEGVEGWFVGWQLSEANKRIKDVRLLRKSVEADLNRLELQLLQGDPSLAFIRDVLARTGLPLRKPSPPPQSVWLEAQFASGALPRDPQLLRTLLEQARRDPELVVRLITQAKDAKGRDIYDRATNDPSRLEGADLTGADLAGMQIADLDGLDAT